MPLKTLINTEELSSLLGVTDVVVLDCRFYLTDLSKGKIEYDNGHIPGAIFVDVHNELAGPETDLTGRHPLISETEFADNLQKWGVGDSTKVIVYDDMGGSIAARAWWMLAQQNINVRVLNGGFPAWNEAGLKVSQEAELPTSSSYRFNVSFPWEVKEKDVIKSLKTSKYKLVDARASDRFHGKNETIDPIAGHIPGAINRPFSDNLDSSGYFKPAEQLHVEWSDWLLDSSDDYVYYCGSGITGCHNVLALNYAGIDAKQVYVGSWSQWAKRTLRESAS